MKLKIFVVMLIWNLILMLGFCFVSNSVNRKVSKSNDKMIKLLVEFNDDIVWE